MNARRRLLLSVLYFVRCVFTSKCAIRSLRLCQLTLFPVSGSHTIFLTCVQCTESQHMPFYQCPEVIPFATNLFIVYNSRANHTPHLSSKYRISTSVESFPCQCKSDSEMLLYLRFAVCLLFLESVHNVMIASSRHLIPSS